MGTRGGHCIGTAPRTTLGSRRFRGYAAVPGNRSVSREETGWAANPGYRPAHFLL